MLRMQVAFCIIVLTRDSNTNWWLIVMPRYFTFLDQEIFTLQMWTCRRNSGDLRPNMIAVFLVMLMLSLHFLNQIDARSNCFCSWKMEYLWLSLVVKNIESSANRNIFMVCVEGTPLIKMSARDPILVGRQRGLV